MSNVMRAYARYALGVYAETHMLRSDDPVPTFRYDEIRDAHESQVARAVKLAEHKRIAHVKPVFKHASTYPRIHSADFRPTDDPPEAFFHVSQASLGILRVASRTSGGSKPAVLAYIEGFVLHYYGMMRPLGGYPRGMELNRLLVATIAHMSDRPEYATIVQAAVARAREMRYARAAEIRRARSVADQDAR